MRVAVIFDVDGVLVDSPHERAWRESLRELAEGEWIDALGPGARRPVLLDTQLYQAKVAGKPRLEGARAALAHFGFPDVETRATHYASEKQRRLEELIASGACRAFPDALRLVARLRERGVPLAAASSSRNANQIMGMITLPAGEGTTGEDITLLDCFPVNVCGRAVARGKPAPDLFLLAAAELGVEPGDCVVVEDAPSGVAAAKSGGMKAIGIARLKDEAMLQAAGADLVVGSLDEVALDPLLAGRLSSKRAA